MGNMLTDRLSGVASAESQRYEDLYRIAAPQLAGCVR